MNIIIRNAEESDSEKLWVLMRDLAIFEKYIDSFAITPDVVRESGFHKTPPDFHCILAEDGDEIAGMLVYYFLPYTAQNRPAVYIKELFVAEQYRGKKIGERLMDAVKREAKKHGCTQIKWTVAPWNEPAKRFYERLGAKENNDWISYEWEI